MAVLRRIRRISTLMVSPNRRGIGPDVNGVRLVSYEASTESIATLRETCAVARDRRASTPITDEIFQVYRDLFDYDPITLDSRIESVDAEAGHWTQETVSFDATYDDERVLAHVFLPKNIEPPYQVVVYHVSSDAIFRQTSEDLNSVSSTSSSRAAAPWWYRCYGEPTNVTRGSTRPGRSHPRIQRPCRAVDPGFQAHR